VEMPNGDFLSTAYNCSMVYMFDRETGDVKWRWGKGIISFPHDPQFVDNGNILLLDDQRFPTQWMPPDGSRILEVNPKTNEIEWEWRPDNPVDFHNTYMGGVQRLPNGNSLVCQGGKGHFFEVAPDGDIVWEYMNPFYCKNDQILKRGLSNAAFRAQRIGPDHPGLQGKDLNPATYNTWNAVYGPGVVAGSGSVGAGAPRAGEYESIAPSVGEPDGLDEVDARAQMLGYT
jgi:outer membrane protein assembly factor BamB